jgi:hypothetical protein
MMKLKNGFVTHEMGSEQIMVATGDASFPGLVRSNATAAFIVDCLKDETTKEAIVEAMLNKYDVSEQVAAADVDKILEKLRSVGALDE